MISFCIPTVEIRESLLSRALWSITSQPMPMEYEILVALGDYPMGDKLNGMFKEAQGEYVVALDDDDYLSPAWFDRVDFHLEMEGRTDFVGYQVLYLEDGKYVQTFNHRGDGSKLWRDEGGFIIDRGVSPKCLTRTAIAQEVPWDNQGGSDRRWSGWVQDLIRDWGFIDAPLYIYDHWGRHMLGINPTDPGFGREQRDVGLWPYDERRVLWV